MGCVDRQFNICSLLQVCTNGNVQHLVGNSIIHICMCACLCIWNRVSLYSVYLWVWSLHRMQLIPWYLLGNYYKVGVMWWRFYIHSFISCTSPPTTFIYNTFVMKWNALYSHSPQWCRYGLGGSKRGPPYCFFFFHLGLPMGNRGS